ncbi:MAG: universal stress protein [Deinococcales bacterium]
MKKAILLGLDGSESSERALAFALDHALKTQLKLIIVHIIPWSPYGFNTPEENETRHLKKEQEIETAQRQVLNPIISRLPEELEYESLILHGNPAQLICQIARDKDVEQIVVGRRGRSNLTALFFGSVTGSLVQIAPAPVTVVP